MPEQGGVAAPSEIHAEALNVSDISLCWSTNGPEQAIEITDRADNERRRGPGAAFKNARYRARLGARDLWWGEQSENESGIDT
jgi:hypothetical protein